MALIRPLAPDVADRRRRVDRWFLVAQERLHAWTCRRLSGAPTADRDDAFQYAAEELCLRILKGVFSSEPRASDRAMFAVTWSRLVLDWLKKKSRFARETVPVDDTGRLTVEALEDSHPAAERLLEDAEQVRFVREWRKWRLDPLDLLVLACQEYPIEITEEDVRTAAGTKSFGAEGLTRPVAETFEMLDAWRNQIEGMAQGERTRTLIFILRGPAGERDPAAWDSERAKSAGNWLYQRRKRALQSLHKQLLATDA